MLRWGFRGLDLFHKFGFGICCKCTGAGAWCWQVQPVSHTAVFHLILTDTLQSQAQQVQRGPVHPKTTCQHKKKITPPPTQPASSTQPFSVSSTTPHSPYAFFHDSALPRLNTSLSFRLGQNADRSLTLELFISPNTAGCRPVP